MVHDPAVISEDQRVLLLALVDVLLPGVEGMPSGRDAGAVRELELRSADDHAELWSGLLGPGLAALDEESKIRHGIPFAAQPAAARADLLRLLGAEPPAADWPVAPELVLSTFVRLSAEAYYGTPGAAWSALGYHAGPARTPGAETRHVVPSSSSLATIEGAYDVVVVGAGAGGGVAACVLAEAGARVLLVDRGEVLPYERIPRDHLRNHRLPLYGQGTGPGSGNPRVLVGRAGQSRVIALPHDLRWHGNAMTVGGGTRVYQGMAWRMVPDDFRLATIHGVPDGSSLADWPLTYEELEPHYTWVEWNLGVCGDAAAHPVQGRRSRPYPMPPLPSNPEATILQRGADALGLATGPVPLLINSVPRDGRATCVGCGECVGFPCPSDAKNGTFNTVIPRALATGNCTLVTSCRALEVTSGTGGVVDGVRLLDETTGAERTVAAGHVVVAAGAIETARLLLGSRDDAHPHGLGNQHDQVGRNLQGHLYVGAFGRFSELVQDSVGPGVSVATCDFLHDPTRSVIGGGVLANEVVKLPILVWYWGLPAAAPRWGSAGMEAMRHAWSRTSHVYGPVQEIPAPDARVTLAEDVLDRCGRPVARLEGRLHPETLRSAEWLRARAVEWMAASGAEEVRETPISDHLTAGQHQAGTCRMGDDPTTSVTDRSGRVHGHHNLWVADASLHVTNGGVNPVLTILALAHRTAQHLARSA
jgi:choline dehydrogenase-like flavoprotein